MPLIRAPRYPVASTTRRSFAFRRPSGYAASRSRRSCERLYWLYVSPMRARGRDEMIRSMLTVRTLTDGGQQPLEIARAIADFFAPTKRTLDIALYDLKLGAETE